jgi:hypothetical protein
LQQFEHVLSQTVWPGTAVWANNQEIAGLRQVVAQVHRRVLVSG